MTIGERIKKERKRINITQEKLGELSGIAGPTIRRYELGKLNPKITTIEKIAKALNVSPAYLMGYGAELPNGAEKRESAGIEIKKRRKALGLTQEQLSHITGISVSDISKYENRNKEVPVSDLEKMASATFICEHELTGFLTEQQVESQTKARYKLSNLLAQFEPAPQMILTSHMCLLAETLLSDIWGNRSVNVMALTQDILAVQASLLDDFKCMKESPEQEEYLYKLALERYVYLSKLQTELFELLKSITEDNQKEGN